MADGPSVATGGADDRTVFERAAWGLVPSPPFWPLDAADALPPTIPSGDDVVLPHNPWAAHQMLTALEQGENRGRFSGSFDPGRNVPLLAAAPGGARGKGKAGASAPPPAGPRSPGGPGSPPPPGGPPPPTEEEIVQMWMKELGIASDQRVEGLSHRERLELARLASRNRGYATGLVENRALAVLNLPGVRGTDQLGLVLTILDRLEHAGISNNGAYFTDDRLFSAQAHELAGVITEMSYLAVVAENAVVNGLRTAGSRRTAVPWSVFPEGLFVELSRRWPRLDSAVMSRLTPRAEIDGYVIGDRLVEVKLRGRGRVPYSRMDEGDNEQYVNEQLQALKLLAIARRDGLRGVEFALFAEAVDEGWVQMVRTASMRMGVGAQIFLYPPHGQAAEILNTMPPMVRRGAPVAVALPPLAPPPEKRKPSRAEQDWGFPPEVVTFAMGFIQSDARVRAQAVESPRGFSHHVRPAHFREVIRGYRGVLDGHFASQNQKDPEVLRLKRDWGAKVQALSAQGEGQGNRLSATTGKNLVQLGADIRALVTESEAARQREVAARRAFLARATPRMITAKAELSQLVGRLGHDDYTHAPNILWRLDAIREISLHAEFSEMLRESGLGALENLLLPQLLRVVEGWKGESDLAGDIHRLTATLRDYLDEWRAVIDARLPEAMARWREELEIVQEIAPPTEPFPREAAQEFLARFEAMSSGGTGGRGRRRGPTAHPAGDWGEAVSLLGLGGGGATPALGTEVAAAVALMPPDVHLIPAEIDRLRYALEGIELFHVTEAPGEGTFYYLPQVHTAAIRMIRAVLLTALLRHRPGTTLGLGRTLIFPWVMGTGQRGQQPFWLEVSPGGRPDQLVLERIVVTDRSQLPQRAAEEFLANGLVLALPREGGGTRMVHFDLAAPLTRQVPVDTFVPPAGADIDSIAGELVQASFRDRHPEGMHTEGESRFRPVDVGYLTVAEIEQMRLQDAYLRRRGGKGEEAAEGEDQQYFTAGRIRNWPSFIEHYLDMQRMAGRVGLPLASYYHLHVRTSHRGGTRVLLHLDRIRQDFGDHLRLRRIPGFALATEIAARGQKDAWGVPWTHSRLTNLYADIEAQVPEAERPRYIRRFRSIAGGSRYTTLEPGQVALNLRELRRSAWGVYFRVERPAGFLQRQDLLDRGMSTRSIELILQFIERNIAEQYRSTYLRHIRPLGGRYAVIINLRALAQAFRDRLPPDLLREITEIVTHGMSPAEWRGYLERTIAEVGRRIEALPPDRGAEPLARWQRIRADLARAAAEGERDLSALTRMVNELREDVDALVRQRRPGGSEGAGESGASAPPSAAAPPRPAPPPGAASAQSWTGFAGMFFVSPDEALDSTPLPLEGDWSSTETAPGDASLFEGGQYFLDGEFPPVSAPHPGIPPVMH